MKKHLVLWIAAPVLLCVFLVLALALWLWFFPGSVVRLALPALQEKTEVRMAFDSLSGNPLHGWTLRDFSIRYPGVSVSGAALHVRLDWSGLFQKEMIFEVIALKKPHLIWDPKNRLPREQRPPRPEPTGAGWVVAARRLHLSDGRFAIRDENTWTPEEITQINMEASYSPQRFELSSFKAEIASNTVGAHGTVFLNPWRADIAVDVTGDVKAAARFQGGKEEFLAQATATYRTAGILANAAMRDEAWSMEVSIENAVVPESLAKSLPDLGTLRGSMKARGKGLQPDHLTGDLNLEVSSTEGFDIEAHGGMEKGRAHLSAQAAGPGLEIKAGGSLSLSQKNISAQAIVSAQKEFVSQVFKQGEAGLEVQASLSGPWKDPQWTVNASMDQIKSGGFEMESVRAATEGKLTDHTVNLQLIHNENQIHAEGRASFQQGIWRATWGEFEARLVEVWRATHPFTTHVGGGIVRIVQFQIANSTSAHITMNAEITGPVIRDLRVDVRGFNAAALSQAGLVKVPLGGSVFSTLSLRGAVSRPEGTFSLRVEDAHVDGHAVGRLSGSGRITRERLHVDRLDIRTPTGAVFATADIPIHVSGKKIPPFEITLRASRFDLTGFTPLFPQLEMESSNLEADLKITGRNNRFFAEGELLFTAGELRLPKQGLILKNAVLDLTADGKELRIKKGEAQSSKDGKIVLSGSITPARMDLRITANEFKFEVPIGLSGEVDADLSLTGAWNKPVLTGLVKVLEADYVAEKKKKEKPQEKPEPPAVPKQPSPLAMDVKIEFDRNVRYKQGQSSIEFRGDVTAKKEPALSPVLFGTIQVVRGTYIFYGRSFEIEEGRITFLGHPQPNPGIDIRAVYVSDVSSFKVILTISGTLRQPALQLSSEPPLEEMDIIAVLVTGAPLETESGGPGRDSEALAKTLAANYLAEKLRQRVQSDLDIDELRFKVTDTGEAALSVGKNVTHDLFVSYSHTLGPEGQRRVEAEYELSNHWSLEGYTSWLGQYVIDLLFRFGFY